MSQSPSNIPILRSFQLLRKRSNLSVVLFYAIMGVIAVLLIIMAFSPGAQRLLMAKFHLQSGSFAKWAPLQFVPSMYNFANEIWVSPFPLTVDELRSTDELPFGVYHEWKNHYPLRFLSFHLNRNAFFDNRHYKYVYIHSKYRGVGKYTFYEIEYLPNGSLSLVAVGGAEYDESW